MTFIEKQRHGNHDYYYLVKSIRVAPNSVRKARIFLGQKVPDKERLEGTLIELERKMPRNYSARWLSKDLVEKLEDLRATVTVFKSLGREVLPKDFLVRFTYNTNAIEGNPLTLRQTALLLMDSVTPQGIGTESVIETFNSRDAWEFVKDSRGPLDKPFVCKIQHMITKDTSCRVQGEYRKGDVRIAGSEWIPPSFVKVPERMSELFGEFRAQKKTLHPIELATALHNQLVQVHPFTDGNGRTARLLANWVLIRCRFPPVIVELREKEEYYKAIENADAGDNRPMATFLARQLLKQYTQVTGSGPTER